MCRAILNSIFCALLLFALQSSALPLHSAKPGGIAVIDLGDDINATAPTVTFGGNRALVIQDDGRWYAVVGVPLSQSLGTAEINVSRAGKAAATTSPIGW